MFLQDEFALGLELIQSYGWFLLLGGILIGYFVSRMRNSIRKSNPQAAVDEYKKYDSGKLLELEERRQAALAKLQERYATDAEAASRRQAELEERRRAEREDDWELHKQGLGYRSKHHVDESSAAAKPKPKKPAAKPFKPNDYNPLMGQGTSRFQSSPRRTMGGGGGG